MKQLLIGWFPAMLCLVGNAQTITITDKQTGEPMVMATLVSDAPSAFATTNAKGQVSLSAFTGADKITVRMLGYQTVELPYAKLSVAPHSLQLEPISISLDDVVVSATRWSQSSDDVPALICAIPAKMVALQNPQTAADMLAASGKVFIQKSQQGGGSPMIRGFATNRLLYVVDGVRMNTAIFRDGNIQNVISLDPLATESAEVLFGPGSVMYGSDAIGGVMSFSTLTPHLSMSDKPLITGKAISRYATAISEQTMHLDINIGCNKWASVTSLSSNDFGDLRMGSRGPNEYLRPFFVQRMDSADVVVTNTDPKLQKPTAYTQINLMQKLRYSPNADLDIRYGFHYSETSGYARYDRHIRYKNGLPRYGEWSYGPQKWMMNHININHNAATGPYSQLSLRLAHQFFEESRISRDIDQARRETRTEKVNAWSANLDLTKELGTATTLFYGLELVQDRVASTGINTDVASGVQTTGPSRYPQATWASYGAYLTGQHKLSSKLLVQAGLRYNRFGLQARFDTAFYPFAYTTAGLNKGALTGSVGLVYRPGEQWVISSNLATAFRSPNVDDMGKVFDSEPGAVVVPNPSLGAEYAYNVDLGVAKWFGNVLKIDVTAYATLLQHALVRRNYTLNGLDSIWYDGALSQVQAMQNAAVARVYGLQAGIGLRLSQGFSLSSDLNLQHGEEELDHGSLSPSRHAAPIFGTTRIAYKGHRLHMELNAQYCGQKAYRDLPDSEKAKDYLYATNADGLPYSPAWCTLNFKVMYPFAEHLTLTAGAENITDKRYRTYSSGIAAPGRNLVFALKCTF